jgi:large subunit ribosomal protein L10
MTVKEMQELRRKMREGGIELKVIKNTLLKIAADQAGKSEIMTVVDGPTALALAYDDIIEAARAVSAYAQAAPQAFAVQGGFLDGTTLTAKDLSELTKIPPKPVLLAQFMGQMQAPLAGFIGLLDAPLQELTLLFQSLLSEFPGLIEARARQMESAA